QAIGTGGRQVRTGPEFGHIFDHHTVVYEYANGVKLFSYCRQQAGCAHDISDHLFGTRGTCNILPSRGVGEIRPSAAGQPGWRSKAKAKDMYQVEHDELFASIRAGKPINNGEWMSKSTLMAIMGRMATYTGQVITWEMAMNSQEDLTPPRYEFGP